MKILVVTNPEAVGSIHVYTAKCSTNLKNDVFAALFELNLGNNAKLLDDIANELEHGRNYWLNETFCFDLICV